MFMPPMAIGMVVARRRLWPNVSPSISRRSLLMASALGGMAAIYASTSPGRTIVGTVFRVTVFSAVAFVWVYLPAMWIADERAQRP